MAAQEAATQYQHPKAKYPVVETVASLMLYSELRHFRLLHNLGRPLEMHLAKCQGYNIFV